VEPASIEVMAQTIRKLPDSTPENSRFNDERFGQLVSISGTNVIINAFGVDIDFDNSGNISGNEEDQGEVYYYDCSSGTDCVLLDTLQNPNPVIQNFQLGNPETFGDSGLEIEETTLVVSDRHAAVDVDGSSIIEEDEEAIGEAYLYECTTNPGCTLIQTLFNPTPERPDQFGVRIGLSLSSTPEISSITNVIVGAHTAGSRGEAYFFTDALDVDGDGFLSDVDCDDNNPLVFPGAPEIEDGLDNDCDGIIPPNEADSDGDGVVDAIDACPGFDDRLDADSDGIPDGCDENPTLTCGQGTKQEGFECVADLASICGAGTRIENMMCVVSLAVGGYFVGIEHSSLLLAATQLTAAWMIPIIVSGIGIGFVLVRTFRNSIK